MLTLTGPGLSKALMFALGVCCLLCGAAQAQWQRQAIATDADFRGLCAVNEDVAWVSGSKGTFGRTIDGGKSWQTSVVPGAEKLDFRDIEAFSDNAAYLLSIGPGENSRIYKTADGGTTWTMQLKNADPAAFYDAFAFWDATHGIAVSDPVDRHYRLIATDDGGMTWTPLSTSDMPVALKGDGAFAASGTCLVTRGSNDAWLVTGGGSASRVFRSGDRGRHWNVSETPILSGSESAGIFSIAFRDDLNGIITGGDYRKPNDTVKTAAITADGGKTWTPTDHRLPFRSCVGWANDRWIAVGTSGSHVSFDDGKSWKDLDRENYNTASFTSSGHGWAAGPKGRVARFER